MSLLATGVEPAFDAGDTKRVTRPGSFLRKTKLDELPQLWNVLIGDMSFVGPRPEVRQWVDAYPERWAQVHQVKPGITDPASIYFRNEEDLLAKSEDPKAFYMEHILPQKLDLYIQYVKTQSFRRDVSLIFKTILAVFFPGRISRDKLADSIIRKEP
jgi:lipopolysaccharide/colanic/teichoic acid biosynthesis glycosyltransferase